MTDEYQPQRTRLGKMLFNLVVSVGKFLADHMWLHYVLNFTWGLIGNVLGLLVFFVASLLPCKKKFARFHDFAYLILGRGWGGFECCYFFLLGDADEYWVEHTVKHEIGHSFQNAIFGPFQLFIVAASAIRYWLFRFKLAKNAYDAIWFEGSATKVGEYYYERVEKK